MAIVYEESITGKLDSTVVGSSPTAAYFVMAWCWIIGYIELWDGGAFTNEIFRYYAQLRLNLATTVAYPYELHDIGGTVQEIDGGAAGTFTFTGNIKVEQLGDDVKVTITGSLGTLVETYANHIFVRVDRTELSTAIGSWGNAGFYARSFYKTGANPQNFYGEVTTVSNPTRSFHNGGAGEANWSDWDTVVDYADAEYTLLHNATGSAKVNAWPPAADPGTPQAWTKVAEKASDRYSVALSYNQHILSVQSVPLVGVSIDYLPTPDDDAEASPQSTNFDIKYGIEDIVFSPSPDIIGQASPAQSGTFYWVWYAVKYGGTRPDVEFTASGTSGRRNFVRWDYDGSEQAGILLDLGVLVADIACDTHYAYDMQVVAPVDDPPGHYWRYWDFPGVDNREEKEQAFSLSADMIIIATYGVGVGLYISSVPIDEVSIEFDPTPDEEGVISPQDTDFMLGYDLGEDITIIAPENNPIGCRWRYWDFTAPDAEDKDHRKDKTQEFIINEQTWAAATYICGRRVCHFSCADGTIHAYYSDTDSNLRLRIVQRSNGNQLEDFAITDAESDTFPYAWQRCSGMQLYEECLFQRNSDIYHTYNPGGGIEGSWSEPVMAIAGYDLFAACDIPPQGAALILMLLENPDTEVTEVYYAYANRAVDGSVNWGPVTPALVDPGDAFPTASDVAQPEQGASLEFGLDGKFTLTWFDTDGTIYIAKSYDGIEWGEM